MATALERWIADPDSVWLDTAAMEQIVAEQGDEQRRAEFARWFWTYLGCKVREQSLEQFRVTWAQVPVILDLWRKLWAPVTVQNPIPVYPCSWWPDKRGNADHQRADRFLPPVFGMLEGGEVPAWDGNLVTQNDYFSLRAQLPCSEARIPGQVAIHEQGATTSKPDTGSPLPLPSAKIVSRKTKSNDDSAKWIIGGLILAAGLVVAYLIKE